MIRRAIDSLTDHYQSIGLIEEVDREYCRNRCFSLLHRAAEPYERGELSKEKSLDLLLACAKQDKLLSGEGVAFEDDFIAKLTDIFMPRPSEYDRKMLALLDESPQLATRAMYQVALDTDYVKLERVSKNVHHRYLADYGEVEITINVSKPEKSPEEIRLAQTHATGYPLCLLCKENVGLSDVPNPARTHHRILPLTLAGESYFFQYSPYSYFNEHCIIFSKEHEPMRIDGRVVDRFLDFVEIMPHYFISANADLPIVGGSILSHDHYQGGRARFPVDNAKETILHETDDLKVAKLDWPISSVRLSGEKEAVAEAAKRLITGWKDYSNEALGILAKTDQEHNTVNLLARKAENYQLTLLFRNNRTDEAHPDGIFHTAHKWQAVKRENIGIIEAIGLAILPKRLVEEMKQFDQLPKYSDWLKVVPQDISPLDQLGYTFSHILKDCGVFKDDETSQAAFEQFLELAYADL